MGTACLRTLGGLSLHEESWDGPRLVGASKGLGILAYLATTPERQAHRDHLAALLWPDQPEKRRANLRQALYYLRKNAGIHLTRRSGDRVHLVSENLDVDVLRFKEALEEERHREVVDLWEGPFLQGVSIGGSREFREWIEVEQDRTRAGLTAAYHELVDGLLREGDHDDAVRFARRYADLEPLDEAVQRILITTLLEAGRRAQAFSAYQRYGSRLREALGEEPTDEFVEKMRELQRELFRGPEDPGGAGEDGAGGREDGRGDAAPSAGPPARWLRWAAVALVTIVAAAFLPRLPGLVSDEGEDAAGVVALLQTTEEGTITAVGASPRGVDSSGPRPREQELLARGGWIPLRSRSLDGYDAVLARRGGDSTLAVATEPEDEVVVAWSPDGRELLLWCGRWLDGVRRYRSELVTHDLESGTRRTLTELETRGSPKGSYSPDGTRLALVVRRGDDDFLLVGPADASDLELRSTDVLERERPAWSPGGRWIVYGAVADGSHGLFRMPASGDGGPERLTRSARPHRAVAWLPDGEIMYLVERADRTGIRILDVDDGSSRWIGNGPPAREIRDVHSPAGAWVEEVRLLPRWRRVSPGQRFRLEVRVRDAAGATVPLEGLPFRVSSTDTSVVRIDPGAEPGPGAFGFRAAGPGRATVVASAGGWRSDSLTLVSRTLAAREREVLFREDWADGIDEDRWYVWGEPEPYVKELAAAGSAGTGRTGRDGDVGRDGADPPEPIRHAFVNNGDANYASGAATREAFPVEQGLTVEWWTRMPFTGAHFEDMLVVLARDLPWSSPDTWSAGARGPPLVAGVRCKSRPSQCAVNLEARGVLRPQIESPDRWHRHALQLAPDGTVSWIVDGRPRWRSPPGEDVGGPMEGTVHLAVGGNALDQEIFHGPVTVYRGLRYEPAGEPDPGAR